MSALLLQPGNVRVLSVTLLIPWLGIPTIECELDPDTLKVPSGLVTLSIGAQTVSGTVDPRGSGQFVEFVHVRILGGAGGWDKTVSVQWYASDTGVSSATVIAQTAGEVGETANVAAPLVYPARFVRGIGPASRVLEGMNWWVDLAGVTQVGDRPTVTPDKSVTLIRYDPTLQLAELTSDVLVLPGTVLSDPRIKGGSVTVRDVEQIFDGQGSRVKAFCGPSPVAQLMNDLRSAVVEFSGRKFLASYQYRILQQNSDGRLQLELVRPADGMPNTLPIEPWMGPGDSAKFEPGSLVRVAFFAGDPSQPIADSYQFGALPLERTVDAQEVTHIGPSAISVELAAGEIPVALATPITTFLGALQTWSAAVAEALSTAGVPIVAPQAALVAAIAAATSNTPAKRVTAQ